MAKRHTHHGKFVANGSHFAQGARTAWARSSGGLTMNGHKCLNLGSSCIAVRSNVEQKISMSQVHGSFEPGAAEAAAWKGTRLRQHTR
eukprot:12390456-Alexandrium_andersonii.AAC.1